MIHALIEPIDGACLALFRIGLALVFMICTIKRYRWLHSYYTNSSYYYHYELLPFLRPPASWAVHLILCVEILAAAALALGFAHPWSAWLLAFCLGSLFFSDKAIFRHHTYLFFLLFILLANTDASACFSLDNYLQGQSDRSIPAWQLYAFRLQLFIAYTYAGINKCHSDWVVRSYPMKRFLRKFEGATDFQWQVTRYCGTASIARLIEAFFKRPKTAVLASWMGLITDLTVIPLLCYAPTRPLGMGMYLCFHGFNHWFFQLGAFPYMNYAAISLFLDPATAHSAIEWLKG